jgi:DMSO reductase anchor subunit
MQPIKIRLFLDFGLVVLIWMVQLIIYPSFEFYTNENLVAWHKIYTLRISYVVIPLMLGQLGFCLLQLYQKRNFYTLSSTILVISVWLLTFLIFVPMHSYILSETYTKTLLIDLVNKNWYRTIVWTLLFLLSLHYCFKTKPYQS